MKNFWKELPKPFTVLAPMEDVTDKVFRQIIEEVAPPDVFFTEFVNCEGLMSEGKKALVHRLDRYPSKKPTVAQIWGIKPENFNKVATMVEDMGFDGVDINMGCPQRNVIKTGACSALIKNPNLAKEIIQATKEGVKNIPVSVKTRIGFNQITTEEWIGFLLGQDIAALTVHFRTVKEQSKVPAHWEEAIKTAEMRNKINQDSILIGNGDLIDYSDIENTLSCRGMEGGMIGRGIFSNLKAFSTISPTPLTEKERIDLCIKHIQLFSSAWGKTKKYDILKKYYKIYITDFEGSKELRVKLMGTKSSDEAVNILLGSDN